MKMIALHGDLATADMLRRDVGDMSQHIDIFFNARGWLRFDYQLNKLIAAIQELDSPPLLIGYSRGGSAIAAISERVELAAAIVYEAPVLDSASTGGTFPVLQIWNDAGAKYGMNQWRRARAIEADEIWRKNHVVTEMTGTGKHMRRNPLGHDWDVTLNPLIVEWIVSTNLIGA
jgi:hypothetical protein